MEIETIRIVRPKCPGGYAVINKADLKPDDVIHEEEKLVEKKRHVSKKPDL